MKFDPNDPKWTAYVLNELGDKERAELEKEIAQNPDAQNLVDEIRETTAVLSESFAAEPELELDSATRDAILDEASKQKSGRLIQFPAWKFASFATAAAALIIAVMGVQLYHRGAQQGASEQQIHTGIVNHEPENYPSLKQIDESLELNFGDADAPDVSAIAPEEIEMEEVLVDHLADNKPQSVVSPKSEKADAVTGDGGKNGVLTRSAVGYVKVALEEAADMVQPSRRLRESRSQSSRETMSFNVAMSKSAVGYVAAAPASMEAPPPTQWGPSLDDYNEIEDNKFIRVTDHPLSTLSIDVDTASYAQIRKVLLEGRLPVKDAVRIEEMINYFPYDYAVPTDEHPFAANMEVASCPWNSQNKLVRIALKGKELDAASRPPLNLVFLLDVSGSMNNANKLPLVKRSMKILVNQLTSRDHVSMVVYAGAAGLVLPPTRGDNPQAILEAIERLSAGGSTAGGAGIELAYKTAQENFDSESVNRVILCTDGDFNVGTTQQGDLVRMIEEKAKSGVFLNVLGFGMGNYKDGTLENLSNKGNGNYAYIDDFSEARKVLVDEMTGTLVTIAKDVKIQVEFNSALVSGYRLIGYVNRLLKKEDFNNDKVDAGEIGAGHTVTAFYEIVPAGREVDGVPPVDELKYKYHEEVMADSDELLTLKLRYKQPDGDTSTKVEYPLVDNPVIYDKASSIDYRFAASVAAFGQLLRESEYLNEFSYDQIIQLAEGSIGKDKNGYRAEFLKLVRNAKAIAGPVQPVKVIER